MMHIVFTDLGQDHLHRNSNIYQPFINHEVIAIKNHVPVVLFVLLYKVKSVDGVVTSEHSHESCCAVFFCGAGYFSKGDKIRR